jgi:hypothetical protein
MTSRFHKAVEKVEKQLKETYDVYDQLRPREGEALEVTRKAQMEFVASTDVPEDERKRLRKIYNKASQSAQALSQEVRELARKMDGLQRLLALKRRQLAAFLVRKVGYDAAKARKAERDAQKKSNCIQIGIMKIYTPS